MMVAKLSRYKCILSVSINGLAEMVRSMCKMQGATYLQAATVPVADKYIGCWEQCLCRHCCSGCMTWHRSLT